MARIGCHKEVCLTKCVWNGQSSIFPLWTNCSQLEWESHGARCYTTGSKLSARPLLVATVNCAGWRKNEAPNDLPVSWWLAPGRLVVCCYCYCSTEWGTECLSLSTPHCSSHSFSKSCTGPRHLPFKTYIPESLKKWIWLVVYSSTAFCFDVQLVWRFSVPKLFAALSLKVLRWALRWVCTS